ncbi:MAG: accessory Sec system translocase SecA2 [Phycisphaerae bacterium]
MFLSLNRLREIFHRLRGRYVELDLGPYKRLLGRISRREDEVRNVTEDGLVGMSAELKRRARDGGALDGLLVEAFAVAREAARRAVGMRPFDVQILAGIAMHQGKLAEMQTGEGKTLAAVMPAYLNALTGRGVHVLTFNDYLARRDTTWMGPAYRLLGLTVGFVQEGMSRQERQAAYACDITYVTAKEAGFDFLRDRLAVEKDDLVHRPFHFAIVDEADSNLIDEARVPLVIAGGMAQPEIDLYRAAEIIGGLEDGVHYATDEYSRNAYFTEAGLDRLEEVLGCGSLHVPSTLKLLTELSYALHAQVLLRRDVDYIVRDGRVELVDEFTGRVAENRRWPVGLQAAVEAKEGLDLQPEGIILGSITLQHSLRLYPKIAAMTATAQPASDELDAIYGLRVVVIPPNRPCIRIDGADVVFPSKQVKTAAVIKEIVRVHATQRPILVGTSSVEESEHLAAGLRAAGVACHVLNAKNDELEARIVAQAGSLGAVTISTNMAGRGTDIRLGGDPSRNREEVVAMGGLYVIGTNRHESRRIDDQLRGRAGRQGDPGESRFFISLEDDLMVRYRLADLILPDHRPSQQDAPVDDPVLTTEIARAQRIIEGQTFEIRRTLWQYCSLIEDQRKIVHRRRQEVLRGDSRLTLLAERAPERCAQRRASVAEDVLQDVERRITLHHIDRCWAEHLAETRRIREGIFLFSVGGFNPLDEFHKAAANAFHDFLERVDAAILETFRSVEITAAGIDLDKAGLRGPSSTWTYLINDDPFGNWLERFFKGVRSRLRGSED